MPDFNKKQKYLAPFPDGQSYISRYVGKNAANYHIFQSLERRNKGAKTSIAASNTNLVKVHLNYEQYQAAHHA